MNSRLHSDQNFDSLIALHWGRFWRYAMRLCRGNVEDAEDLLSETLLDAYQSFDRFHGQTFDRWVFRMIATNHIDMLRRARVRPCVLMSTLEGDSGHHWEKIDTAPSVEDQVLGSELSHIVAALPDSFRIPLLLCDFEGFEYEEIAAKLAIPVGTVRSRIHRSRQRVREALLASHWLGSALQPQMTS